MSRIYQQRARILVIDNSEINREMLNDILGEIYEINWQEVVVRLWKSLKRNTGIWNWCF